MVQGISPALARDLIGAAGVPHSATAGSAADEDWTALHAQWQALTALRISCNAHVRLCSSVSFPAAHTVSLHLLSWQQWMSSRPSVVETPVHAWRSFLLFEWLEQSSDDALRRLGLTACRAAALQLCLAGTASMCLLSAILLESPVAAAWKQQTPTTGTDRCAAAWTQPTIGCQLL